MMIEAEERPFVSCPAMSCTFTVAHIQLTIRTLSTESSLKSTQYSWPLLLVTDILQVRSRHDFILHVLQIHQQLPSRPTHVIRV